MILAAPADLKAWRWNRPIDPGPMIATVSPRTGLTCSKVLTARLIGSIKAASTGEMLCGNLYAVKAGTVRYSANVPSQVIPRCRQAMHMFG